MIKVNRLIKFIIIGILLIVSYINVHLKLEEINILNILFILWLINSILYKKEFYKIKIFLNLYILLMIILIILSTYQAKYLGYENGILEGNVFGVSYYDSSFYYKNIIYKNSNFNFLNLTFDYTSENKFNIFIIISYIASLIFGQNVINIIAINLIYSLLFIHFYIRLLNIFVKKVKLYYVFIVSFYPGFILINISLMRDMLINLLLIIIIYYFFKNKLKPENRIKIIFAFGILLTLRAYTAFILVLLLFIIFNLKLNFVEITKNIFYLLIIIFIVNIFSVSAGYGVFGLKYLELYMNNSFFISFIETFFRIIFGFAIVKEALFSGVIFNFLVMSSPIYIILLSATLFYNFLTKKIYISTNTFKVMKFVFLFAYANSLILTLRDGIVVERIYNMWIWLFILILSFKKHNMQYN